MATKKKEDSKKSSPEKKASAKKTTKSKGKKAAPKEPESKAKIEVKEKDQPKVKKGGRLKGSKNKPKPEEKHVDIAEVLQIPLEEIKLEDESFMFRIKLKVKDMVESIGAEGLQVPVILRPLQDSDGEHRYQLVSGFRRVTAIKKLGWKKVDAIVRSDLDDDVEAFKVSIIENEARKTYNDLDRANAILAFRDMGKSYEEIEAFFNIGERQRQRLQKLTELPENLQEAVAGGGLTSTHAVRLMQHAAKYPDTDLSAWLERIQEEELSLTQLNKLLRAEGMEEDEKKPVELFQKGGKGKDKSFRIRPIAINAETSPEHLKALQKQLSELTKFVDGLLS